MASKTAPISPQVQQKLDDAAKALAIAAPSIVAGGGKAFEAWVLLEIAAALKAKHFSVQARNHKGAATIHFNVSGGPGFIRPATSNDPEEPCYFEFSNGVNTYELHSGVRHLGVSGHDHELDISVVHKAHADPIRHSAKGGPFAGHRWLGIELKDYDDFLPKIFARGVFGVAVDLAPAVALGQITVGPVGGVRMSFHSQHVPRFWLVTTAPVRPGHKGFLDVYGIKTRDLVDPADPMTSATAIDDIVGVLIADLW